MEDIALECIQRKCRNSAEICERKPEAHLGILGKYQICSRSLKAGTKCDVEGSAFK